MLQIFTLGLALGLYAAAMPGPINLEVIRRSISRGPKIGLMFGLGASLADVTFVLLSSLGALALINSMPMWGKAIMWLAGAIILFWLGINGLRAKEPPPKFTGEPTDPSFKAIDPAPVTTGDMFHSFLIGLALTLSSPPTIMFWIFNSLMVASTHLTGGEEQNANVPYLLAAGVGVACTAWVCGAVYVTGRFHRNLQPRTYVWVERIAGAALCCFASYALFEASKILLGNTVNP
jgi:threonine/homoserine/homoserine lactone efflux protein